VSLAEKFGRFAEHWSPKVVGEFNDLLVKVVKAKGEFIWHKHEEMDEIFLVTKGKLTIKLRERAGVVNTGDSVPDDLTAPVDPWI
jgi:quercetin dioxygenase-like cupin family protein